MQFSRNRMLLLAVFSCLAWAGRGLTAGADERPNILMIYSDDHAYQALSCYGSYRNETPNLDRIANEGMRFDNCFVTNSICGPCRAVVLTGKYSHLNGMPRNSMRFNGQQQTFPKLLQTAGYQTAIVGKWHLASDPTGFDHWEVLQGQGPYYNPRMLTPNGPENYEGYTTDIITDLTLRWLEEGRDADRPFMLMCQNKAPHRRWEPGPDHLNTYADVEFEEPETLFDNYEGRTAAASRQQMSVLHNMSPADLKLIRRNGGMPAEWLPMWNERYAQRIAESRELPDDPEVRMRWNYQQYMHDYMACIASVDDNVGRVLDYLEESGLAENTIVIYSSDQGFYLGEHGWYDKRWMYEESLRTPLMIRWPGVIEAGSVNDDFVLNLDFAETFLTLAGAEIPSDMQGRSFEPLMRGEEVDDWRTRMYYRYYELPGPHRVARHYGIRTERYKLIYFNQDDAWELFDLQEDPQEMNSVYDDPAYAEIITDLKQQLEELREEYHDDDTINDFSIQPASISS